MGPLEIDTLITPDELLLEWALAEIPVQTLELAESYAREESPGDVLDQEHLGEFADSDLREVYGFDDEDLALLRLSDEEEMALPSREWMLSSMARHHILLVNQAFDFRPRNTSPKSKNMPSLDWSPKQNWVDKKGVMKSSGDKGLPEYISRLAKQFTYKKKLGRQTAIKWAVGIARRWCATGRVRKSGFGKLNAGSRSQACAAIKQWEQMKAK